MPNAINYAQKWERNLIDTFIDNSYIGGFRESNVKWLDSKTFNFTTIKTPGYKDHALTGGWNRQWFVQNNHPFTLEHDRDVEFFVDVLEVDESNQTATIQNISNQFMITQATPEMDAQFFSKTATTAIDEGLSQSNAIATWTTDNVYQRLLAIIGKLRRYRRLGLVLYVRPEVMDLLELSEEFTRTIDSVSILTDGRGVTTRITNINGTMLIEVIETDRFATAFDFTDGFEKGVTGVNINVLAATPQTTKFVPKIGSIYFFLQGTHTQGDGHLYQNRCHWDTFTFPNGKDGKIDSIFVDVDVE